MSITDPQPLAAAGRTPDEIVARIHAIRDEDFFGFRMAVLAEALTFNEAQEGGVIASDVTEEKWGEASLAADKLIPGAQEYLKFAIGKIRNHRGISASRSVDKLSEMAWLAGRDDVVTAMGAAEYPQYGAPKVKAFADGMGFTEIWAADSDAALERMTAGLPCVEGCLDGCDS